MKMQNVFFLSGLLCVGSTVGMDQIPIDALTHLTKFLWMDTPKATVRCVLALQRTCRLWCRILNDGQKKKMVSQWINEGKDFREQECLHHSLQMVGLPNHNFSFVPEFFLLAGANAHYITEYGDSVLMFSVNTETPSMPYIRMLIRMGAAINHQNFEGDTALHFAVRNVALECVEVLLLHGADKNLTNLDGKRPIEYTNKWGLITVDRRARDERINDLLMGKITPEKSMAKPIPEEEKKPNAIDALDALLDDANTAPINENFFG